MASSVLVMNEAEQSLLFVGIPEMGNSGTNEAKAMAEGMAKGMAEDMAETWH